MPRLFLFLFLLPCLALAQYPKAMDFSKLYQGKLDSVAVIHRMGWTKETSWPEAPEEEHITEERKLLPLSKGKRLLKILQDKTVYKEEYPLGGNLEKQTATYYIKTVFPSQNKVLRNN